MVPHKEEELIVYCAKRNCEASPKAARKLQDMGYTNVYDFEEGLAGWKQAAYELHQ